MQEESPENARVRAEIDRLDIELVGLLMRRCAQARLLPPDPAPGSGVPRAFRVEQVVARYSAVFGSPGELTARAVVNLARAVADSPAVSADEAVIDQVNAVIADLDAEIIAVLRHRCELAVDLPTAVRGPHQPPTTRTRIAEVVGSYTGPLGPRGELVARSIMNLSRSTKSQARVDG